MALRLPREVAIQFQGQFAGIGLVGHHPFMLRIEFDRMHDKGRDAEGGELPVEVKTARPGFVNHEDLVGQGELFLTKGRKLAGVNRWAGWGDWPSHIRTTRKCRRASPRRV